MENGLYKRGEIDTVINYPEFLLDINFILRYIAMLNESEAKISKIGSKNASS